MAAELWARRDLIRPLTVREIQGRYKGSYLGVVWAVINPLMMLAVYTFVFHSVSGASWNPADKNENFMVYAMHLFIRIIAFNLFSESVNKAPALIISNPNYVKKVVFPLEILPLSLIGSAIFHSVLSLAVLLIGAVAGASPITWSLMYLPLAYVPLVLLTAGFCWALSSLGVFLRDIGNLVSVLVQLLFFLTPIVYPPKRLEQLPTWARLIMQLNPMAMIVDNFGRVVNDGLGLNWREWWAVTIFCGVVAVCGYAWFMKIKRAFADVI
jgi:lipopolysaccharide transport system permease protein